MGMALDEPNADDETYDVGGLQFVFAPSTYAMIQEYGAIQVDYVKSFYGGDQFFVYFSGAPSTC